MSKNNIDHTTSPRKAADTDHHIVRIFIGTRTADEVVADLIKVHHAA